MDVLADVLEIFYRIIKCIMKFLAWIFNVAVKDIVISLFSIGILFLIIFYGIIPRFMFNLLLLAMLVGLVYKIRGKIKNYLNKKGIMDYFK
ncbi:hypothetical protein [Xenorhabdus lircayensis]|uniref:Uncharacterized protein n=1 Tax=Xenorhabdus lircayensis TaxID=2763499 RepID=A0ABS0U7L7_9GAMM|nr:hypothetical protein [Xenorhabdus lircayensis]MBI6549504.1 hypothetical protein [Xenorhabdus lircayensis]